MPPRPLPGAVSRLLEALDAPPRLVAHLALVHDVACTIVARCDAAWPALAYDREAVRLGAAIHDAGKVAHPAELSGPGHAHEAAGEALLLVHRWPERLARFARTHARWSTVPDLLLEDLLVALADKWWRWRRDERLEAALYAWIVDHTRQDAWQVYLTLDGIAGEIAAHADERLAWQSGHAL